jgi:hypothetical protein
MGKNVRIALTDAEREECPCVVAFKFSWHGEQLCVSEQWTSTDELYGDGCTIRMPPRVWREMLTFAAQGPTP